MSALDKPVRVELSSYPGGCKLRVDKVETWYQTYDEAATIANQSLRKEWEQPYHNC